MIENKFKWNQILISFLNVQIVKFFYNIVGDNTPYCEFLSDYNILNFNISF